MDHHNFLKNGHLYDRHGKLSTIKYRRNSFHHRIFIQKLHVAPITYGFVTLAMKSRCWHVISNLLI